MPLWDHLALPDALAGPWRDWRAPILAFVVTLLAAGLGRALRVPALVQAAACIGIVLGPWQLIGFGWPPATPLGRLFPVAVAASILAFVPTPGRIVFVCLALACAWWLAGAPHPSLDLWPWTGMWAEVLLAGSALAATAILLAGRPERVRLIAVGASAAAALAVAHAGHVWLLAALCPVAATLGTLARAPRLVPIAAVIPAVSAAWMLAADAPLRAPAIAVAFAPLVAALLVDRLRARIGLAAGPVTVAATACLAWIVVRAR